MHKTHYHGGAFEGNECRRLVHTAATSSWEGELADYTPLFVTMESLYTVVFAARDQLSDDDLQEIAVVIQEFFSSGKNSPPNCSSEAH